MSTARNGDGGSVTAEFAIVVPAVIAVLALVLGGIALGRDALSYATAANHAARAMARGQDPEQVRQSVTANLPGVLVEITEDLGEVCVTVRAERAGGEADAGATVRSWLPSPSARSCASRDV